MVLIETLTDLWRLIDARGRLRAAGLVLLVAAAGLAEVAGMALLFGYIAALDAVAALRDLGPITDLYTAVAGELVGLERALASGAVLVVAFLVKNLLWLLASFLLLRFAMKQYVAVATRLFDGFQEMPLELMRQRGVATPMRVLSALLQVFQTAFTPALQALADIAVIGAMLLALAWAVGLPLVLAAGATLGTGGLLFLLATQRLSERLGQRHRTAQIALANVTADAFRGLIDARIAGRQTLLQRRFGQIVGEFAVADRRSRALDLTPRSLNEMILAVGIVLAAAWFAGSKGGLGAALPTLAVLGFAGLRITSAASRLMMSVRKMRQASVARREVMAAVERAAPDLLGLPAAVQESFRAEDLPLPAHCPPRLSRCIRLENLSFRYPDAEAPAVDGVTLSIPRGSFVAFCGPSGGGKSTLALLLMGLLRPTTGRVLCDDWDVNRHISAWMEQIGYVSQTPFFSNRSVRENVAFGLARDRIDDTRVWQALDAASIGGIVRGRPGQLGGSLGDDGTLFSGGQRQRIAIARALHRDPSLLVFDEATAALDTITEREVTAAIEAVRADRTVISIAHRLTTIRAADTIHLVENGRIVRSGSYEDLIATSATFRALAGTS
ncbi:MAG: ABC transporter ATP-binding protein [Pseudomonadota bacterium]